MSIINESINRQQRTFILAVLAFLTDISRVSANPIYDPSIDVGRILRTFKIKKNVEVTDNGKIII